MSRSCITQTVTRALNPTGGFLRGFAFTLNPYVGCAFGAAGGCPFCYVRALPVARAAAPPWGDWVIAKINLPELLGHELARLDAAGKLRDAAIFMSSATDPYQGAERTFRLTRRVLESFARRPPGRILLQTRSPMVERDLDLLKTLRERLIVSMTMETDDEQVRRALTPTSAGIARRLRTAYRLRDAGVFTQIAIAPMLPNNPARLSAMV